MEFIEMKLKVIFFVVDNLKINIKVDKCEIKLLSDVKGSLSTMNWITVPTDSLSTSSLLIVRIIGQWPKTSFVRTYLATH